MNWWRAHHGISNDSKLGVVALRARSKRCEVGWIWIILLDFASQNEVRGSIIGLDHEQIALMADLQVEQVSEILDCLKQRGLIHEDGMLSAWEKRQPKREREDLDAVERKRRQRAKSNQVTPENGDVTPSHAQIRGEEIRVEEKEKPFCLTVAVQEQTINGNGKRPLQIWFDQQHEDWYQKAYWNHRSKIDSRRAYEKAVNRIHDRDHVGYNQAQIFLKEQAVRDRQRFEHTWQWKSHVNLLPATWLNGERWTDEDSQPQAENAVVGADPNSLGGYQELK